MDKSAYTVTPRMLTCLFYTKARLSALNIFLYPREEIVSVFGVDFMHAVSLKGCSPLD